MILKSMRLGRGICLRILLALSGILLAGVSMAGEREAERSQQERLEQSRGQLRQAEGKLKAGVSAAREINTLKALAEEIKAFDALLSAKFRIRGEDVKTRGGRAVQRQRAMEEGYQKALGEYLGLVEGLQAAVESDNLLTIEKLTELLDRVMPRNRRPILGSLPYRSLNYPSREPYAGVSVRPAYKGGSTGDVTPEDTMETDEAPLSAEIAALAQSLKWNPVLIYEYVMNTIETEWYWGCMKGAEETLHQRSGNDCDQATLLTALLRVSGFPTRYIRGTVEFFAGGRRTGMDKVKTLFGMDDPSAIAAYLQKAGIPCRPVIAGGQIENFQVEHIWVETQVPYGNYRGAIIDDSDKTWLALDTSIKVRDYIYNSPSTAPGSGLAGLTEEYLLTNRMQTPLEYLKTRLMSNGQSAEDFKSTRAQPAFILKILPSSTQFTQRLITHEYTQIPDELKQKVRFVATAEANPPLFDITLDTHTLSNQSIVLSYEPETVEDQEIIDAYGGLDDTPAYLVRLRPVLKRGGERIAAGRDGLPMGTDHDLTIELISPNGAEKIRSTHTAGNVSAIAIVSQRAVSVSEANEAETVLYRLANRYIDRWNQAEDELASLLHLQITRPIPTVVTTGGVLEVSCLLDTPHGVQWKGVYIDANLRAVTLSGSLMQKTFMQISALQGSVLEDRIFEDDLGVEGISTAKLFQHAGGTSSAVTIDRTNIPTILAGVGLDEQVRADIENAVNQNLIVKFPAADGRPLSIVSHEDWSGIGYIKENPVTGEAGYMLSGMLAGGMTALNPDKWGALADILGNPYDSDYNSLMITSPQNESLVTSGTISVSGTVLDAHASVEVNGIQATVLGNAFTAEGIILTRGMNTITATATNYLGRTAAKTIRVKYKIPVKTYITFPFDGSELSGPSVDVEGEVSDNLATVEVNGVAAEVSAGGRYSAKGVLLNPGANLVTATARNAEGETDTFAITVNGRETPSEPISVTITSPRGEAVINRPSVMVTGTFSTTAEEVSIKVNGVLAEVTEGRFAASHVPLVEGNNTIVVHAIDTNGSVARAEVSVRSVRGPYVTLTANITSGIPVLGAYFRVSTELPNPAVSYQMDFEGDGVVDYTAATFEDITRDYTTEGIYHPTITVTDDQGNVYTDTIAVIVLNRAKIDALLKGKWEKMKEALGRGDVEGAMNYFAMRSKDLYRSIFTLLKDQLPLIMQTFVEFNIVTVFERIAGYEVVANENGTLYSYPGTLIRVGNGQWKFRDF